MKQKLKFIVLFGCIFSSSFAQQLNTAKLDSLFQILEAKNKYMGSIAIAANGKLRYT